MRLENSGLSSPDSGIERTARLAENQANFKIKVRAKLEAAAPGFPFRLYNFRKTDNVTPFKSGKTILVYDKSFISFSLRTGFLRVGRCPGFLFPGPG
jgi:hypothetical protein